MKRLVLLAVAALFLSACKTKTSVDHAAHLERFNHIFVEHVLSDGHSIDELIARELRSRGYDASAGPLTMMPPDTEAIIAYQAEWTFDFTTYMIELDIAIREAKTGRQIGVGQTFRPAFTGNDPMVMIKRVIDPTFPQK